MMHSKLKIELSSLRQVMLYDIRSKTKKILNQADINIMIENDWLTCDDTGYNIYSQQSHKSSSIGNSSDKG